MSESQFRFGGYSYKMTKLVSIFLWFILWAHTYHILCAHSNGIIVSGVSRKSDWLNNMKLAIAGGLAGGLANAIIYPIDTIKTIRQSDSSIKNSAQAINRLRNTGWKQAYSGFIPAVLGAIPSSALYFGS